MRGIREKYFYDPSKNPQPVLRTSLSPSLCENLLSLQDWDISNVRFWCFCSWSVWAYETVVAVIPRLYVPLQLVWVTSFDVSGQWDEAVPPSSSFPGINSLRIQVLRWKRERSPVKLYDYLLPKSDFAYRITGNWSGSLELNKMDNLVMGWPVTRLTIKKPSSKWTCKLWSWESWLAISNDQANPYCRGSISVWEPKKIP